MKKNIKHILPILAVIMCLVSGSVMAQTGFGIRAGVTADPTQFHFGGHFISDSIVDKLIFRPNLEIGVGSHAATIAANFEFAYPFQIQNRDFSVYVGGGPALVVTRLDEDRGTDTGGGFNMLIGLEHKDGLFGEMKVGAFDSPGFKFTIGYTFR